MKMLDVEFANAVISIMDLCGALNIEIESAVKKKFKYNSYLSGHRRSRILWYTFDIPVLLGTSTSSFWHSTACAEVTLDKIPLTYI